MITPYPAIYTSPDGERFNVTVIDYPTNLSRWRMAYIAIPFAPHTMWVDHTTLTPLDPMTNFDPGI
jgi:hypothetical protein